MTTKRIRTGLRIPYVLNSKLIAIASDKGISKNSLILQILWDWVNNKAS